MIHIHELGTQPYRFIWEKMKAFTQNRQIDTVDELWVLDHPPVYTLGQAGKKEHILSPHLDIPVVHTDRGGQVTYHGPGQLIAYCLFDLKRRKMGIKTLVYQLEQTVIDLLQGYELVAERKCGAPGIYIQQQKIASIGLRIKNGCSYHGVALNVNMDLAPFQNINPCGYPMLSMTQLHDHLPNIQFNQVIQKWISIFLTHFES